MRRKEKEITDRKEIEEIIKRAPFCRVALCDGETPYIVPVCFGYDGEAIYFHCATEGRKIDILGRNSRVCFEMDIDTRMTVGETACSWALKFRSVVGFGTASLLHDPEEKRRGLNAIMRHYEGPQDDYPDREIEKVGVVRITVESMTGKRSD